MELIFKEFFRGEQRFHGIFREKSTISRISSGVDPFLREVFRGLVEVLLNSSGVRRKVIPQQGGADVKCNSPLIMEYSL